MPQFPLGRSQVTGQATSHGGIQEESNTCIDCHEGVVHELPPDYEAGEDDE
ncbi:MAG: NapC/NirT family cytochrome c [Gammaproteobacteria bacterium]|nr:NapC/NirT family cytochrome c [Gammaproteobacteria bacterium]